MPLSWDEIRDRATAFAADWKHTRDEDADAKRFIDAFFEVFGVKRRKVASFEKRVKKLGGRDRYVYLLWKGTLLIEQKSRGKNLVRTYKQAIDYFPGLSDDELPRWVLVSDFWQFELHDLDEDRVHRFTLRELPARIELFHFIAGCAPQRIREQDPINVRAVLALSELHDDLGRDGYTGHELQVFLVRLLFCLFADKTGIFQPKDCFHDLIEFHTREDGSDLGPALEQLFSTLNREPELRQRWLAEHFAVFQYVNGRLFEEHLTVPSFNADMRGKLLRLCRLSWGSISPAIFGAMLQTAMHLDDKARRRELGAHYTSEANILRLIGPLFLEELRAEFDAAKAHRNRLFDFHQKLQTLTFLDPACGCGNFLVVAYRELRRLEIDVLRAAAEFGLRIGNGLEFPRVDVDQFFGIEIEEFPAHIAQVALWLTDQQMNLEVGDLFGETVMRIPLTKSAHIRHGNALRIDWAEFVPPQRLSYILGNPPFIGKQHQDASQKADLATTTQGLAGAGVLDFVAGWFILAARYITDAAEVAARRAVRCAFVSTNSITQGEQVGVLWRWMLDQGLRIQFAHRSFKWTNEAPGRAAVHCVIIGFGVDASLPRRLFDYPEVDKEPQETRAGNINPYLVDAPDLVLPSRKQPLVGSAPPISFGSMPNDGQHLLLSDAERKSLLEAEPRAAPWVQRFMGADEFINDIPRWCLWLKDCPPMELRAMPLVSRRVATTKSHRESSTRPATRALAAHPTDFGEVRQPPTNYLLIPSVSSERRTAIPIGFMTPEIVASNAVFTAAGATVYDFGILSSTMHNAWVRYTCGRLESRYRYSAGIVYNNFPWPLQRNPRRELAVASAAQAVLDSRACHAGSSLADLYDPDTMPPDLVQAHRQLDRAVDAAYLAELPTALKSRPRLDSDAQRVAFLFLLYQQLSSLEGQAA